MNDAVRRVNAALVGAELSFFFSPHDEASWHLEFEGGHKAVLFLDEAADLALTTRVPSELLPSGSNFQEVEEGISLQRIGDNLVILARVLANQDFDQVGDAVYELLRAASRLKKEGSKKKGSKKKGSKKKGTKKKAAKKKATKKKATKKKATRR